MYFELLISTPCLFLNQGSATTMRESLFEPKIAATSEKVLLPIIKFSKVIILENKFITSSGSSDGGLISSASLNIF